MRGMRPKTFARTEARRVSDPAQKGEFAESATKSGTLRESAATARMACSSSGTETWTCSP